MPWAKVHPAQRTAVEVFRASYLALRVLPQARRDLAQAGLGIVKRNAGPRDYWLAIPNQDPLTRTLFEGSKWMGEMGASVWAGALRQSPRWRDGFGGIHDVAKSRIGGVMKACTLIALDGLYGDDGIMA